MENEYPFVECFQCNWIGNCPNPDVSDNVLPHPIPPENCPKRDKIRLTNDYTRITDKA